MGQSVTRLKTSLFARATSPLQSHSNASLSNIPHALRLSPSLSLSLSLEASSKLSLSVIDRFCQTSRGPTIFFLSSTFLSFTHLHFSPIGSKIVLQVLFCFFWFEQFRVESGCSSARLQPECHMSKETFGQLVLSDDLL
ncbi:unnamed protein product [Citrullus colocynthis]|uniref:Uncharacterized protein n=1 Tax=Citrullus colocynthis TaxID=252529 RepID=A0ABP0YZJ2_9ROSI